MGSYSQAQRPAVQRLLTTILLVLFLLFLAAFVGASAATALDPSVVWLPLDLAGLVGCLGLGLLLTAFTRGWAATTQPGAARQALGIATVAWAVLSFGAIVVVGLSIALAVAQDDIAVALLAVGAAVSVLLAGMTASSVRNQLITLTTRSPNCSSPRRAAEAGPISDCHA